MATIPAHSPIYLPYLGRIPGGLRQSYMIRVRGSFRSNGQRISIDLQCGPALNPLDDIALHLSIRPNEFSIVRNHYEKFRWGSEERGGGCPIRRGQSYEILILAESTGYKIAIDGVHYCDFRHRISMNRVQYIHINGETDITSIGYETEAATPVPCPAPYVPYQPSDPGHHHHHHRHHSPNRPPIQLPIAPTAPTAPPAPPVTGIIAGPYPGPPSYTPLYPSLNPLAPMPMPTPMPINPTPPPPPPYSQSYVVHKPIETNPYPPPYTSSPYPAQQQPIKVEQNYSSNQYPSNISTCETSYPTGTYYQGEKKKHKHTALKIAAAAGGIGLGAYALSKVLHRSDSSSSSD